MLHYLTRSVRRRAASFKSDYRTTEPEGFPFERKLRAELQVQHFRRLGLCR